MWFIANNERTGILSPARYAENTDTIAVPGPAAANSGSRREPFLPGPARVLVFSGAAIVAAAPGAPGKAAGLAACPAYSARLLAFCPVNALMSGLPRSRQLGLGETGEP